MPEYETRPHAPLRLRSIDEIQEQTSRRADPADPAAETREIRQATDKALAGLGRDRLDLTGDVNALALRQISQLAYVLGLESRVDQVFGSLVSTLALAAAGDAGTSAFAATVEELSRAIRQQRLEADAISARVWEAIHKERRDEGDPDPEADLEEVAEELEAARRRELEQVAREGILLGTEAGKQRAAGAPILGRSDMEALIDRAIVRAGIRLEAEAREQADEQARQDAADEQARR